MLQLQSDGVDGASSINAKFNQGFSLNLFILTILRRMIVYMNLTSVRQLSAHECDAAGINAGRLHVYSRLNQYLSLVRGIL